MACVLCCSPVPAGEADAEAAKKAEAEEEKRGRRDGDGTDEEKEKLVTSYQDSSHQNSQSSHPQGAFVPSPQAPPIEEVDEGEDDEEEEEDSQAGLRHHDRNNPNHPHDMPLRSIPEEKQYLLGRSVTPLQRPPSGGSGAPLATPEDTGV